jgi:hypothetical protein
LRDFCYFAFAFGENYFVIYIELEIESHLLQSFPNSIDGTKIVEYPVVSRWPRNKPVAQVWLPTPNVTLYP